MIDYKRLANVFIDMHIDLYGVTNTITVLYDTGYTIEDMIELGFDIETITSTELE